MCFKRKFLLALMGTMIFVSAASAAERLGAIAATNAKSQAASQAAANLGGGGAGVDLRAISSPRQQPRSLTGLPAGTFSPGVGGGSGGTGDETQEATPGARSAFAGEPLTPILGPELFKWRHPQTGRGFGVHDAYAVVDHAGYAMVQKSYLPTSLDDAYVFHVLEGRSRRYILYFDRSALLLRIEYYDSANKEWVKWSREV